MIGRGPASYAARPGDFLPRVRPVGGFTRPMLMCACGTTAPSFHWELLDGCPGCAQGTVVVDTSPVLAAEPARRSAKHPSQLAAARRNVVLAVAARRRNARLRREAAA